VLLPLEKLRLAFGLQKDRCNILFGLG